MREIKELSSFFAFSRLKFMITPLIIQQNPLSNRNILITLFLILRAICVCMYVCVFSNYNI